MKRLAFLGITMATLIAPIQVQAQQYDARANCVRFPQILTRKQKRGICSLIRMSVFVRHES